MRSSPHPGEKGDLIKMIEKYGYNMKPPQGGNYMISDVNNIYLPLGANSPDEEVILKFMGFEKTGNSKH